MDGERVVQRVATRVMMADADAFKNFVASACKVGIGFAHQLVQQLHFFVRAGGFAKAVELGDFGLLLGRAARAWRRQLGCRQGLGRG